MYLLVHKLHKLYFLFFTANRYCTQIARVVLSHVSPEQISLMNLVLVLYLQGPYTRIHKLP